MNRNTGGQLNFNRVNGWGGKRKGAGRTNLTNEVNHMARPRVTLKTPLHITVRLADKLPSLRRQSLFSEFKKSIVGAKVFGLYVLHFSVQSNHIHLIAEAEDNKSLALGMRALAGRFAKIIRNYASSRGGEKKGSVFKGRYHIHVLKTPREMKNVLEYVLLNLSKHQKFIEYVDHFSSGDTFKEWKKLLGVRFRSLIKFDHEFFELQSANHEILSLPQSWLAKTGWMRAISK